MSKIVENLIVEEKKITWEKFQEEREKKESSYKKRIEPFNTHLFL